MDSAITIRTASNDNEITRAHMYADGSVSGAVDLRVTREYKTRGFGGNMELVKLLGYRVEWTARKPGARYWGKRYRSVLFATETEAMAFANAKFSVCCEWLRERQPVAT